MELRDSIRKHSLENAVRYEGKANPGAVIGKIIAEFPELKSNMKEVAMQVNQILKEINAMSLEKQTEELRNTSPEFFEKKVVEKKDDLKELDNVDLKKGVVMRFAPSPSGPMHIGHAFTGGLTSLYTKKYNGKFILRIEDTNSDNIDPIAYEALPNDAKWIFGNVTEVWIQSDRLEIYYNYVQKFLDRDAVYICTCTQENFKKHVDSMTDCPCRKLSKEEQKDRWSRMFDKAPVFKEGEAVVRFKAGMQNNNPAMRDFPLARINDSVHPRQGRKYRVWPLMNLSVTVDDIEAGMTHIIRAKDHADNSKRQEMMYKALGLESTFPKCYFTGRYNFEGLEISCSKTREKIKSGEFSGWDDIRVPFLMALKRRGYQPGTFIKYTQLTGLSLVDKTIPAEEFFKSINSFNKELIEPIAKRFFFVHDYEQITIKNSPKQELKFPIHPENSSFGERTIKTNSDFLLQKTDLAELKENELYRLMDCLNFKIHKTGKKIEYVFDSLDYETFKSKGKKIMHFLPADDKDNSLIDVEVLMPDASKIVGKAEADLKILKVGDIIQFERFGFCRLDEIVELTKTKHSKIYKFWFAHK